MAKILLFPLSNVLGHLGRTLALAEALAAQGDEACVVASRAHARLLRALPPGVRVLHSPELPPVRPPRGSLSAGHEEGAAADRSTLERSSRLPRGDLSRRGERLRRMLARDAEILASERPDAIVADGRATPVLLGARPPLFQLANWLGHASFVQRATGAVPFPLGEGRLLVPGIPEIEGAPGRAARFFGPMVWGGWARLGTALPCPPPSDVLLSFGSTGDGARLGPWLARALPRRYRLTAVGMAPLEGRPDARLLPAGSLAPHLAATRVVLCHGGHGTVMESLLHGRPVIVFPANIEQLEIGRRIQHLGLGRLAPAPGADLTPAGLEGMVEELAADVATQSALARVSHLLCAQAGAAGAAAAIRETLEEGL